MADKYIGAGDALELIAQRIPFQKAQIRRFANNAALLIDVAGASYTDVLDEELPPICVTHQFLNRST